MATDINRVYLIGRLTRDIELKYTHGGTAVASIALANNKSWTQNGKKKEQVSFFNCVAWSKGAEILAQYGKKGDRLAIEGRLQQRSWQDKDGSKRQAVEVIIENFQFLSSKQSTDSASQADEQPRDAAPEEKFDNQVPAESFDDESIPF